MKTQTNVLRVRHHLDGGTTVQVIARCASMAEAKRYASQCNAAESIWPRAGYAKADTYQTAA